MKKYNYSNEIANVVKQFLDEDDWHYSFDENRGNFKFGLCIDSKMKNIRYLVDVDDDNVIVYGTAPVGADSDDKQMMAKMAEYICRVNYGLQNGSFELDFRDGEIRFKSYVDCDGCMPGKDVIRNSVHCTAMMFERYSPGMIDIIFAGSNAKEAIEKCEKSPEEELRSMLSVLGEEFGDGGIDEMLERVAQRLGIATDDETECLSAEDTDVHMDLFRKKEGAE